MSSVEVDRLVDNRQDSSVSLCNSERDVCDDQLIVETCINVKTSSDKSTLEDVDRQQSSSTSDTICSPDDHSQSNNDKMCNQQSSSTSDTICSPDRHSNIDDNIFSQSNDNSSSSNFKKKSPIKNKPYQYLKIVDTDSEDDDDEKTKNTSPMINKKFSNIIDSESESDTDECSNHIFDKENNLENSKKEKKKTEKKRTGSARASKEAAMQQIHSETQRLMRESQISLPYHRPKQRTLQEFLNRKKISVTIPQNLTCAEKVKLLSDVVSKVVKEKEKEAEEFYKSSDSEEEETKIDKDKHKFDLKVDEDTSKTDDKINNFIISDACESTQNQALENLNDESSSVQKNLLDNGVCRKLFLNDDICQEKIEKLETPPLREETANLYSLSNNADTIIKVSDNNNKNDDNSSATSETIEKENSKINDKEENVMEKENSTEDFVLQLQESETNIFGNKNLNESHDSNTDFNEIKVAVKEIIDDDELIESKNNKSTAKSSEETEDMILKFSKDDQYDKIIDDKSTMEEKPIAKDKMFANANLPKRKPVIKSFSGSVIDLLNPVRVHKGVDKLLDRFTRHSVVAVNKNEPTEISEIKVMRTEGSGNDITVIEELLPFNKTLTDDVSCLKERIPGQKLKILKEDLKRKILLVKNEEWKQKEENEKEDEESSDKDDDFYAGLPDDEEDEYSTTTESEPEENDVPIIEKKRLKCEFGDEEAEEESLDEDDEKITEDEKEEDSEENDEDEDDYKEEESKVQIEKGPKKLKRIIKAFDEDDSNDSDVSLRSNEIKRNKSCDDIFATQISKFEDLENESITNSTSQKNCSTSSRHILSMISPLTHAPNDSASNKSCVKTPKTPNFDYEKNIVSNNCNLQRKLFVDPPQKTVDDTTTELLEICSGKFTESLDSSSLQEINISQTKEQNQVTDSQLMEICSGEFFTQVTKDSEEQKQNDSSLKLLNDETSQDMQLIFKNESVVDSESKKSPVKNSLTKTIFKSKNPMDAWLKKACVKPASTLIQKPPDDEITESQLHDLCSGTFTTQLTETRDLENDKKSQRFVDSQDLYVNKAATELELQKEKIINKEPTKLMFKGLVIASSSDDESKESENFKKRAKKKILKKKKVPKLELSDDDDNDEEKCNNEFSDLEEEEESEYEEVEEENYVDYDSEEEEIVVVPKKEIKKVAGKFLDKEAELSESEWGSDDEDEQGLDKFEYEEGDAEEIDEDKVKSQLDRIHMKQVMDEDQRDVKMLQELLFDDGDLHSEGAGRERKFKWKNVDDLGENDRLGFKSDDSEGFDDDIDVSAEIQMRKLRSEQQKFLEEKEKKMGETIKNDHDNNDEDDDDDDDFGSKSLKSSLKIVNIRSSKTLVTDQKMTKSFSNSNTSMMMLNLTTSDNLNKSTLGPKSFSFSNMRESFLARGKETLIRIAKNLPESNKLQIDTGRKKTFVFQHISPKVEKKPMEEVENTTPESDKKNRKRKIIPSQQTPTMTLMKKTKFTDKKPGKKLF